MDCSISLASFSLGKSKYGKFSLTCFVSHGDWRCLKYDNFDLNDFSVFFFFKLDNERAINETKPKIRDLCEKKPPNSPANRNSPPTSPARLEEIVDYSDSKFSDVTFSNLTQSANGQF